MLDNSVTPRLDVTTHQAWESDIETPTIRFDEELNQYVWPNGMPLTQPEAHRHVMNIDFDAPQTVYWLWELCERVSGSVCSSNAELLDWLENSLQIRERIIIQDRSGPVSTEDEEGGHHSTVSFDDDSILNPASEFQCIFDCGFLGSWNAVGVHEVNCEYRHEDSDLPPHLRNQ